MNDSIYSLKNFFTQLGYEKVSMTEWDQPDKYQKERKINYIANFQKKLGGSGTFVKIIQKYSYDKYIYFFLISNDLNRTQMEIKNIIKLSNKIADGLLDIICNWNFKTPGKDVDITLFHVTLELTCDKPSSKLDSIKRSMKEVLLSEIDFWINEFLVKKILKQKSINKNMIVEPKHNLEPDQPMFLKSQLSIIFL